MMFLLHQIKKRFALKAYVTQLPLVIQKEHGKHKRYTEMQITDCVKSAGLNLAHISYAWAIFLDRADYDALKRKNPYLGDYEALRREIGARFFNGKIDFDTHDIFADAPNGEIKRTGTYG